MPASSRACLSLAGGALMDAGSYPVSLVRTIAGAAPHRVHAGNRPNSVLLYAQTDARTLGSLLALYEHKIFVQGCVWGINSFDQFGVELGKKLAAGISMSGKVPPTGPGSAALAELIAYVARARQS